MKTLPKEDIRRIAGQMLIVGVDGFHMTAETRELLREVKPLGVILFARNVESPEQVASFNEELKQFFPERPFLLAVDQEGGRVARLRAPLTEWPPMRELGSRNDPTLTRDVHQALGDELRALNFDVDFSPVLDVDTNPQNPVIGDRSFSSDPQVVARHGIAAMQGLTAAGIASCGKHFPGHGDTDKDSHTELPILSHDLERLRNVEWVPFKACIEAGLESVMTAHVRIDCLDSEHPATLSPKALQYLRSELGFSGVIISDDLEMKAVADHYSHHEMATRGLRAGIDVFLTCNTPEMTLGVYRAIVQSHENDKIPTSTFASAEKRITTWAHRWYRAPTPFAQKAAVIASPKHQEIAARF